MKKLSFMFTLFILAGCGVRGSSPNTPSPANNTVVLNWIAPTTNTDGSALTNISKYNVYYDQNENNLVLDQSNYDTSVSTNIVIQNLSSGIWYFTVTAVNSNGVESAKSNIVVKTF